MAEVAIIVPVLRQTPEQIRFWSKVRIQGAEECWSWLAQLRDGYGQFHLDRNGGPGTKVAAHRYSYELALGQIEPGLTLDHLCRNRACVNPTHLEPVSTRENTLRGVGPAAIHAKTTICPHGHPYDSANTYIRYDGKRACRICQRKWHREKMRRRRARVKSSV